MWFRENPNWPWSHLWYDYCRCACGAICHVTRRPCEVCGANVANGQPVPGGERSGDDYVFLELMQREWERPASPASRLASYSERASIVILFWTYFESRMDRLVNVGFAGTPHALREDVLKRYSGVGARMDKLYRVLFGGTYAKDLKELEYEYIAKFLAEVQDRRNRFSHGEPSAIDDDFVRRVVSMLRAEHEAWIAVFNCCVRRMRSEAGH